MTPRLADRQAVVLRALGADTRATRRVAADAHLSLDETRGALRTLRDHHLAVKVRLHGSDLAYWALTTTGLLVRRMLETPANQQDLHQQFGVSSAPTSNREAA